MKAIKVLFGALAGLWALASIPKVFGEHAGPGDLSFSYHMGAIVGLLFAAALSFALFRSAFSE